MPYFTLLPGITCCALNPHLNIVVEFVITHLASPAQMVAPRYSTRSVRVRDLTIISLVFGCYGDMNDVQLTRLWLTFPVSESVSGESRGRRMI